MKEIELLSIEDTEESKNKKILNIRTIEDEQISESKLTVFFHDVADVEEYLRTGDRNSEAYKSLPQGGRRIVRKGYRLDLQPD